MTTRYKTQAITFQKSDTNESDRMFFVFSSDYGRLDLFAKAIRKINSKLKGGIDIFSLSNIEFIQGKNRKTLTDTDAIEKFGNIVCSPQKFHVANKIGEVLDNFLKGEEKDNEIFNLLCEIFKKLDNMESGDNRTSLLYYYFLWSFLSLQGYSPEVAKCADCRGQLFSNSIYFSLKEGGALCEKCSGLDKSAQRINSDMVKILRLILNKNWQILYRLKVSGASREIFQKKSDDYYSYILSGHSFKNVHNLINI